MKKIYHWIKGEIHKLMELPDRPHAVAMGVACGVCIGFTPLIGIKTVLAFVLAIFMRGNRLAAVLVVNLHDILLPLMPLIMVGQYKIGEFLIGREHHQSQMAKIVWPHWDQLFSWDYIVSTFTLQNLQILFHEGLPLLIGSLIFGLALAPIAYYLTLRALQRVQARRLRERDAEG